MKLARALAAVAAVLACAAPPAQAAFAPPELFVRTQTWDALEPAGDWIPFEFPRCPGYRP